MPAFRIFSVICPCAAPLIYLSDKMFGKFAPYIFFEFIFHDVARFCFIGKNELVISDFTFTG